MNGRLTLGADSGCFNDAGGNTQGVDCEQLSMSKRTEDNLFYVLLGCSWEIIGYKYKWEVNGY